MSGAPLTEAEIAAFVEAFVEEGYNFRAACRRVGRSKTAMYVHRARDPEFARRLEETKREAADEIYARIFELGVRGELETGTGPDGVRRPVTEVGEDGISRYVRRYDRNLLLAAAKALRPEFRDKASLDVTNSDGSLNAPNELQLARRVASLLAIAQARKDRGEVIDVEPEPAKLPHPGEDLV